MIIALLAVRTKVLRKGWNYLWIAQSQIPMLYKKIISQSHQLECMQMQKRALWTIFSRKLAWMLSNIMQAFAKSAKCTNACSWPALKWARKTATNFLLIKVISCLVLIKAGKAFTKAWTISKLVFLVSRVLLVSMDKLFQRISMIKGLMTQIWM